LNFPSGSACSAYSNPTTGTTAVVTESSSSSYADAGFDIYGLAADASSAIGGWSFSWYLNQTSSGTN